MLQMEHALGHRRGKKVDQIGAMEVVVGRAEVTLARVGERLPRELASVVPSADDNRAGTHAHAAHRILEAEAIEDSRRVGTYLDARADLAQFGSLFEHKNIQTGASKCQRGCEAADPGTDDYHSHGRSLKTPASRLNLIDTAAARRRDPSLRRLRSG